MTMKMSQQCEQNDSKPVNVISQTYVFNMANELRMAIMTKAKMTVPTFPAEINLTKFKEALRTDTFVAIRVLLFSRA